MNRSLQQRARPAHHALPGRAPARPGIFLQTRFLDPLGLTQTVAARQLGISRRRLNEIIRGRRAISADTALRLAQLFQHDAVFWVQLQASWDLHQAWRQRLGQSEQK